MSDGTLLRAVRHNGWANVALITFCSGLSPEQRALMYGLTIGELMLPPKQG